VRKSAGPAFVSYLQPPRFWSILCTSMAKYGCGMLHSALTSIFGVACCLIGVEEQYISRQTSFWTTQHVYRDDWFSAPTSPQYLTNLLICNSYRRFWSGYGHLGGLRRIKFQLRELTPCSRRGCYCARVSTISWSTRPAQPSLVSFNSTSHIPGVVYTYSFL
jgi:hypothetical protein